MHMISPDAIILNFPILLYAIISLPVLRFLLPRFSPSAKRLAIIMLLAQATLIILSQPLSELSTAGQWLWSLTFERNIPNTLASAQLALDRRRRAADRVVCSQATALAASVLGRHCGRLLPPGAR